ncbi:MAG: recombinase family protein [Bacilli bacterium]|nr:recombinase family protein [Bacilli bacterium]
METTRIIRVIPKKTTSIDPNGAIIKKKVAAYARVSTDFEDQRNSFKAQLEEYSERIKQNPEWEFVKLYSDEGISGTSLKNRKGFKEMIDDALAGKIDLILTKSISRWARNTVDFLTEYRKLRDAKIAIYFDKEHINSLEEDVEFQLTIYASMAQEESKTISSNVKWGVRSRMKRGERKMVVKSTLGYDYENGKIVIKEQEAETVRSIFSYYKFGYTLSEIAKMLTSQGIKTGTGKSKWESVDVKRILTDEKYIGNFVMQKTVIVNFLDHKPYKNDEIEPKYIFENHHPAIVSKVNFDYVQKMLELQKTNKAERGDLSPLHNLVICSSCHRAMNKLTQHPGTKFQRDVLTCKKIVTNNESYIQCPNKHTVDYELAMKAAKDIFDRFFAKKCLFSSNFEEIVDETIKDIHIKREELLALRSRYQEEIQEVLKKAIHSTASITESDEFNQINAKLNDTKAQLSELDRQILLSSNYFREIHDSFVYLDTKEITCRLLKKCIKVIIKKPDGGLRFVASTSATNCLENSIDELLSLKPIYENTLNEGTRKLSYDLVRKD